jgi:hypothetical protein
MVPIITREGIEAFKGNACDGCPKKNARLRRPPAQRSSRRQSDLRVLPFGRLWYDAPNAVSNAIGDAMHDSRLHDAVIRVSDATGNVIETREHAGDFKEP